MGQPVVHFEIIGKDGEAMRNYYSELFGWEINADNPINYGTVDREGNTNAEGIGIGGGVGVGPEGYDGHVTVYIEVPDVEAARGWYASPAYLELLPLRTENSDSTAAILDGVGAEYRAAGYLEKV